MEDKSKKNVQHVPEEEQGEPTAPQRKTDQEISFTAEVQIETIEVMIVVERPSKEELVSYNRAEKYKILKKNHTYHQQEISTWLEVKGVHQSIKLIDQPTAFNILFAQLPADMIEYLQEAPGIIEVTQVDDFNVDLLSHKKKKSFLQRRNNRIH